MTGRKRIFRGDRLRGIRELRQLSQDMLAEQMQIGESQMNRYETGKSDPSPEILVKMAQVLDVTTDYLLGLSEDPTTHLTEDDLTEDERRLLAAFRHKDVRGIQIFSERLVEAK